MELLKLLNANEVVVQIINFLLLLFILRILLWKRFLKILDDRKERIAAEIKKGQDSSAEAARIKSQYESQLALIDAEARKRVQEALAEARKITEEVRKKAHEEAQEVINNAKANIKHELAFAKEELKDQIIDLTLAAAQDVIQDKLTEKQDRKIIKDFLDHLDEVE